MADQEDEHSDPPAEEPARLPFKKRGSADKSLPRFKDNDDFFFPVDKKMNLDELKKEAYYEILKAFVAESSTISAPRIMIMKQLKNEWNIFHATHTALEARLKTDKQVQQLRKGKEIATAAEEQKALPLKPSKASHGRGKELATAAKELKPRLSVNKEDVLKLQERLNIAPAKIPKEKGEPSSTTTEDSLIPSWGDVSPASLVNKWVNIRMDDQDDYVEFLIADYDAETEMHQLLTSPSKKQWEDPCDWIDIRYFPPGDIVWNEEDPGIPKHKRIVKPGQTILHATNTAREKRRVKEVGKSDSGIPIIRKIDKGKGIA